MSTVIEDSVSRGAHDSGLASFSPSRVDFLGGYERIFDIGDGPEGLGQRVELGKSRWI
jgi:hypothetical protein